MAKTIASPSDNKPRCGWVGGKPHFIRYHDQEWGVPIHSDRRHFEMLLLEGAQAGLTWETILLRREGYRNRLKIESAVINACISRRAAGIRLVRSVRLVVRRREAEGEPVDQAGADPCHKRGK